MNHKTVLITGASRGLGAAVARLAAELGASVALNARSAGELAAVAEEIRAAGGRAIAIPGDVSDADNCRFLVKQTIGHFGRLDALVNNAGTVEPIAPLATADPAGWQRNLAVNVLGPMMLVQAALPHLRQSHGRVVNVSSGAAVSPVPGWAAYCAAKGALNQFNRVLAAEEETITAVAVRPGVVDTEMQAVIRHEGAEGMPASAHARFIRYHEAGELLPPEKPGRALAVLALYAPHEWSGEFLSWDEERVQALVRGVGD
ncbi:MAG: SDR family NAD(P)-dependent oxidoreductase [Chloroflexi bacterium]|nr:SDR family NAD(P)-dependent oxidoreductase [Chloroflexota bacterium]MCI0576029.1 SDR family NAD(P)-dependent oxidoreductase [Chloroflexota bacterium]MCI0645153.1 SDR family NAD(P)-dependent oxidoreductase [Chloroflexota bacterium]MCI0725633.1 SDR family NAD(P)-dependent oxidoreductase [Chloroflexota bacterium]